MKRFLFIMAVVVSMVFPATVRAEESQDSVQLDVVIVAKLFVQMTFGLNYFSGVKFLVPEEFVKDIEDSVKVIRKNDKNKLFEKLPIGVYADTLVSDSVGENARLYLVYVHLDYGEYGDKFFYLYVLKSLNLKMNNIYVVKLHELTRPAELMELKQFLELRNKK